MTIIGAGTLNANNYRAISMHKNINVLGSKHKSQIKVSDELTKSLKGKTDQEKRDEVVRYFLRNHDIHLLFQDDNDIVIESVGGIDLDIGRDKTLSPDVLKEISQKYSEDRMRVFANEDVNLYWLTAPASYNIEMQYDVGEINEFIREMEGIPEEFSRKRCMSIEIGIKREYENGQLVSIKMNSYDKVFLKRLVEEVEDAKFYGYSEDLFRTSTIHKCKINGRDVHIIIGRELAEVACEIDEKINNKEKNKKLQYKMEGF